MRHKRSKEHPDCSLQGQVCINVCLCARFSPTGSVVVVTERQRAKSESPNRADELRQPSSQVPGPEPSMGLRQGVWLCQILSSVVNTGLSQHSI